MQPDTSGDNTVTRRDVLKLGGTAVAGMALTACVPPDEPVNCPDILEHHAQPDVLHLRETEFFQLPVEHQAAYYLRGNHPENWAFLTVNELVNQQASRISETVIQAYCKATGQDPRPYLKRRFICFSADSFRQALGQIGFNASESKELEETSSGKTYNAGADKGVYRVYDLGDVLGPGGLTALWEAVVFVAKTTAHEMSHPEGQGKYSQEELGELEALVNQYLPPAPKGTVFGSRGFKIGYVDPEVEHNSQFINVLFENLGDEGIRNCLQTAFTTVIDPLYQPTEDPLEAYQGRLLASLHLQLQITPQEFLALMGKFQTSNEKLASEVAAGVPECNMLTVLKYYEQKLKARFSQGSMETVIKLFLNLDEGCKEMGQAGCNIESVFRKVNDDTLKILEGVRGKNDGGIFSRLLRDLKGPVPPLTDTWRV